MNNQNNHTNVDFSLFNGVNTSAANTPVVNFDLNTGDSWVNAGDFGIGLTNPTHKLHVNCTGLDGIKIDGSGTGDLRIWMNNGAGGHFMFDDISDANTFKIESANDLAFNTNGANERMRIDDNGEVAINTSPNPNSRFRCFTDNDLYGIFSDQDGTGTAYGIYVSTVSNGAQSKYGINSIISGSTGTGNHYGVRGSASTSGSNIWAMYASGDFCTQELYKVLLT